MKLKPNLKLGILINFFILKFLCLIPFSINLKTFQWKFSFKSIIWCILFSGTLVIINPYIDQYVQQFSFVYSMPEAMLANATYIMFLVCVYWSIFNVNLTFELIKLFLIIFEKLNKYNGIFDVSDKVLKQFLIKFTISQILIVSIHYCYHIFVYKTNTVGVLFMVPVLSLKYIFGCSMLIKYDFCLILIKIGFSKINKIIQQIIIQNKIRKNKMAADCETSDQIDDLAEIYAKLCKASVLISRNFSIPILSILLYIFIMVEAQFIRMFESYAAGSKDLLLRIIILFLWSLIRVGEMVSVLKDGVCAARKVTNYL